MFALCALGLTGDRHLVQFAPMTTRVKTARIRFWPLLPGLLGLVLFVLAATHGQQALRDVVDNTNARKQTRMILVGEIQVLSLLKDVETGQRGYQLTGDPDYLEPYYRALARLPGELAALRRGVARDFGADRLDKMDKHIARRLALAAEIVELRRTRGAEPARRELLAGAGKAAMEAIRADFTRLDSEIEQRLKMLDAKVRSTQDDAKTAGILLVILAGLLLALAYALLLREQRRRVLAEQALTSAANSMAKLRGAELESVFEALPDLFFRLAPDGTILDYRARHDDLYIPPEHFLGKRMQDVLPPEVGALFAAHLRQQQRQGGPITFEYPLTMADGERHFEARLNRLPGLADVIVVVRDISERVLADRALRQAGEDLRAFASKLDRDIENERRRLAREVHDQLGQIFTALKLRLLACTPDAPLDVANTAEFETLLDEGIKVARRISADLRPPMLDDLGLGPALAHFGQALGKQGGFAVEVDIQRDARLGPEYINQMFRIAQEALTNVARHAQASRVCVKGTVEDGHYLLSVEDDGRGPAAGEGGGLGMLGMRERAALVGAELEVGASPLGGLRLALRLPLIEGEVEDKEGEDGE